MWPIEINEVDSSSLVNFQKIAYNLHITFTINITAFNIRKRSDDLIDNGPLINK